MKPPAQKKTKPKFKKYKNKIKSLWKLQFATVCHTVCPLAQTALLANVYHDVSLTWFEISGFCYAINTVSRLEVPSIKLLCLCRFVFAGPDHSKLVDGVSVREDQLKVLHLGLSDS